MQNKNTCESGYLLELESRKEKRDEESKEERERIYYVGTWLANHMLYNEIKSLYFLPFICRFVRVFGGTTATTTAVKAIVITTTRHEERGREKALHLLTISHT